MHPPTTTQLGTAIEVLQMLEARIQSRAEHAAMHSTDSPVSPRESRRVECNALEQTTRIEGVIAQLEQWRTEVSQEGGQGVSDQL